MCVLHNCQWSHLIPFLLHLHQDTDQGLGAQLLAMGGRAAWNAASIEKRHELLAALAQDVWKTTPLDV
ncbi:hypothetical protein EII19_02385 [Comamonadaceae bacterium OH2310_COT-174]|nr:hypothetical protein EII19_02385 [Comamonadaceae bacterium OH2310_COT-174]